MNNGSVRVWAARGVVVVVLSLVAGGAQAYPESRRVSLRGVDRSVPGDVVNLYARLRRAARAVCASSTMPVVYSQASVDHALESAVMTVGWTELSAVHTRPRSRVGPQRE